MSWTALRVLGRACAAALLLAACSTGEPASVSRAGPVAGASASGLLEMVNAERRARGLAPLRGDGRLRAAAGSHAADMGVHGYGHRGSDGSSHGDRIARRGFTACLSAENIAWGQRSAAEVFAGWMGSRGHRRNILHPRVTHFGAGFDPRGRQWVMLVASPCSARAPAAPTAGVVVGGGSVGSEG